LEEEGEEYFIRVGFKQKGLGWVWGRLRWGFLRGVFTQVIFIWAL